MKKYIYTGFLILVLILPPVHSFAAFIISPGIGIREVFNDNIDLVDTNEEYDFITTLTPSVRLEYSSKDTLDLSLEYEFASKFYTRHKNRRDDAHMMIMSASARPFKQLFIDITDTYERKPIDNRNAYSFDNFLVNTTDTNSFSASTGVVLPVSTSVSTTVGYAYTNVWREFSVDSETQKAFFVLNNRFSSKLAGALRYDYNVYKPDLTVPQEFVIGYNRHKSSFSIEYRIASNFVVDGGVGESWTEYDTRDKISRMTFGNIGAGYTFRIKSKISMRINYSKFLSDSTISGASRTQRGDLFLRIDNILKLEVNPFFEEDTFLNANRNDKMKGVNIDMSRSLSEKTIISLDVFLEDQRFMPGEEKVGRYGFGCRLDYKLSSEITSEIGYKYTVRNSNIDTEDFNNNIVWLQARVSF